MKAKLLLLLIFFQTGLCIAQPSDIHFANEPNFEYEFWESIQGTILDQPDFDSVKFQARIWVVEFLSPSPFEVFVITLDLEEKWTIRNFRMLYSSKMDTIVFLEKFLDTEIDVNSLWMRLLENQILSLKDYRDLDFYYEYNGRKMKYNATSYENRVSDGELYKVELITKDSKRKYEYYNPNLFSTAFNYEPKEVTHFLKIVDILEQMKK